jgi:hypothetical protein
MSDKQQLISSLTKEQEAMIPEYYERYLTIGMSTEASDRKKAEAAVQASYDYLADKDKTPRVILEFVWAESPFAGAVLAAQHAKGSLNITNAELQEQASQASYGSFESFWVSTYAYIAEVLPVKKDELIVIVQNIINSCGVYWTFEDLVVMTPKPTTISMVDKKAHSVTGPYLAYPNGDCIYAVDGVCKKSLMEVILESKYKK